MALSKTHRIIWLDPHIGDKTQCHAFKQQFTGAIDPDAKYADSISSSIAAINENAAPFIFVDTHEKAIEEIQKHQHMNLIFMSSGALGKEIIPKIAGTYPCVYAYYIFCADQARYNELVRQYASCLQIFDHESDILVRLMRDISLELINRGRLFLDVNDLENAHNCFKQARNLNFNS